MVNDRTEVSDSKSGGNNGVAYSNLVNFLRESITGGDVDSLVLSALQLRPLEAHQAIISFVQSSIEDRTCSRLLGFRDTYSCVSSAYIMQFSPWAAMISSNGAKKRENSSGPRTDPCGTPKETGNSEDWVSLIGFYTSCSNISQKLPQKFSRVAQKLLISPKSCSKVAFYQLKKNPGN